MPDTEHDVVAMPSLRADGTPDQTPDYKVLDPDTGEHADASAFNEFREVTQETVLPPTDSEAAQALPDNVEGTPVDESTGVAGTAEAQVQVAADSVEAAQNADTAPGVSAEPAPASPEQQAAVADAPAGDQASSGDQASAEQPAADTSSTDTSSRSRKSTS